MDFKYEIYIDFFKWQILFNVRDIVLIRMGWEADDFDGKNGVIGPVWFRLTK